jgi:hypothetical protein
MMQKLCAVVVVVKCQRQRRVFRLSQRMRYFSLPLILLLLLLIARRNPVGRLQAGRLASVLLRRVRGCHQRQRFHLFLLWLRRHCSFWG